MSAKALTKCVITLHILLHGYFQHIDRGLCLFFQYSCADGFTIDDTCDRLLKLPLDLCNAGKDYNKKVCVERVFFFYISFAYFLIFLWGKGGFETDLCGQWRFDPGSKGTDM